MDEMNHSVEDWQSDYSTYVLFSGLKEDLSDA